MMDRVRLEAAGIRSAELHSAVSPNCIRQGVGNGWHAGSTETLQIANPRYGRVQLCATSVRQPATSNREPHPMGKSTFTSKTALCNAARPMRKFALLAAVLGLVLAGCATSTITNLTTTRQPRNPSGLYPIEFVWDSNQATVIDSTIKPSVVIGFEFYPMRPALGIVNRWETVVPVPAEKKFTESLNE